MKKKTQKDVVFEIVKEVLGPLYSPDYAMRPKFSSGSGHDDHGYINNIQRMDKAIELFILKIQSGEIERPRQKKLERRTRTDYVSDSGVKTYARSIIYNWLNKDLRLNGGKKYDPKKEERSIFERDSVLRLLCDINGRFSNVPLSKEINEITQNRKEQLLSYEGNLYLVSKCLTDEPLQNLIKKLISTNYSIKEPFLNIGALSDIESVIIKIIDLCKNEIVNEIQFEEMKKSA